jgi:exodeoxyribonuclease VII large subunit
LHQTLREARASASRRLRDERAAAHARALALARRAAAAAGPELAARRTALDGFTLALAAHDPERVVERGYAVVDDRDGNVLTSAEAAREAGEVRLFFADGAVDARIEDDG